MKEDKVCIVRIWIRDGSSSFFCEEKLIKLLLGALINVFFGKTKGGLDVFQGINPDLNLVSKCRIHRKLDLIAAKLWANDIFGFVNFDYFCRSNTLI
jgi:hypothetical protein